MCGGLPARALPLDPVGGFMRGAARPPLGAPCGGLPAPRTPRPAFEKSGGKPAGKLFWVCNGLCWPAAHGERRARFVCRKARRERVGGWIAWMVENSSGSGGGGGRAQRAQSRGGGPWPPPLLWFCGPFGPAKRRRPPGVTQRRPPTPAPAHPRRPYGGCLGAQEGWGGHAGGGGVQGPGPKAPAPEHARCRACPAAGGWA